MRHRNGPSGEWWGPGRPGPRVASALLQEAGFAGGGRVGRLDVRQLLGALVAHQEVGDLGGGRLAAAVTAWIA